jgi:hypothetical protein
MSGEIPVTGHFADISRSPNRSFHSRLTGQIAGQITQSVNSGSSNRSFRVTGRLSGHFTVGLTDFSWSSNRTIEVPLRGGVGFSQQFGLGDPHGLGNLLDH